VEKQRTKELEEELRIIKLKLNTETQAKRDLQLQILRGNNAPSSNGKETLSSSLPLPSTTAMCGS
jgi:hypothetical protein